MTDAVTDTHSLIWYLQDSPRLGPKANSFFDACDRGDIVIYIPTICLVEIIYLEEKQKIPRDLSRALQRELRAEVTNFAIANLSESVVEAIRDIPRKRVPDMPDRIIAATAKALHLPLISRDRKIQIRHIDTIW